MAARFNVFVDEDHSKLLRYTGCENFTKDPISHVLLLTPAHVLLLSCSCLTAIINHVIKYCETGVERNGENLFCLLKLW